MTAGQAGTVHLEKLKPAFPENNIAVASCMDNGYVPYYCVALQSILDHAAAENNYDLIVLSDGVTEESKGFLRKTVGERHNVSLRFVEIGAVLAQYELPTTWLSPAAYGRLLLPDILQTYPKVIYLDCDVVLLTDVAELYRTELGDDLMAAVQDVYAVVDVQDPKNERTEYTKQFLKLKKPDEYCNSGVLVFNVPIFHREFSSEFLLEYSASREWKLHDQDVLATLVEGRVRILGQEWNVLVSAQEDRVRRLEMAGPGVRDLKADYAQALKAPKLLHFTRDSAMYLRHPPAHYTRFWEYAVKTPVITQLMERALAKTAGTAAAAKKQKYAREYMQRSFETGQTGFRYILSYAKGWLKYKLTRKDPKK